jgi:hypothetical protein
LVLHLILLAALGCASPATSDLTGLWESAQTSKGGIGVSLEFRADGTFVEAPTVQVNGYYRVEANRIFLTERADDRSSKDSRRFRMDGTALIIEGPGRDSLRMDRIDGSKGTSVLGAWRYKHYAGALAFERYLPDGRMNLRIPMVVSSSGCYTIGPDGVRLTGLSKPALIQFERNGDSLILKTPGRSDAPYVREPAGAWYDWPSR